MDNLVQGFQNEITVLVISSNVDCKLCRNSLKIQDKRIVDLLGKLTRTERKVIWTSTITVWIFLIVFFVKDNNNVPEEITSKVL